MDNSEIFCYDSGEKLDHAGLVKPHIEYLFEVKEDEDSLENINDVIDVHKFCTDCGLENESSYKFCINCGNDLQNHQG